MASFAAIRPSLGPAVPKTLEELGISKGLVLDLMLRRLLLEGYSTLELLSSKLKLSMGVLSTVFTHMRQQHMVEIKGMVGNDYHFALSASGRSLASERFQISQYAGACPVALNDYHAATNMQAAHLNVDRGTL